MFRFHSNLRDHEASVHSDDRPWVCNYAGCDKTFKIKNSLTEHIKRHHEKITYRYGEELEMRASHSIYISLSVS